MRLFWVRHTRLNQDLAFNVELSDTLHVVGQQSLAAATKQILDCKFTDNLITGKN